MIYLIPISIVAVVVAINVYIRRHPETPEQARETKALMQSMQP